MKNPEEWAQESLQNNCGTDLNYELIVALVESVRDEFRDALWDACADNADFMIGDERKGIYVAMDVIRNFNKDQK